jgi:hypothetical protein
MNKPLNLTLLLLLMLLTFTGCKTKKQIVKTETTTTDSIALLVKKVQLAEPDFRTANFSKLNMNIAYDTRKMNNISTSCRMIRDSAIFVSIQPVFGIELFSVEISPDSITIIDKMNRRYYTATYQYIFQKTGIAMRFEDIQAMLTNSLFTLGEKNISPQKLKTGKTSDGNRSILSETGKIKQENIINNNYEIEHINLTSIDGRNRMSVSYEMNQLWGTARYPKKVTITGNLNKTNFNADIEISRVVFNVPVTLNPANKSTLTRGNIEQLLSK